MSLIENRVYRLLWLKEDIQLIIIKSNGLMRVYKRYGDEEAYRDILWLDEGYKEIKRIMKSSHNSETKYYYAILTDENGTHSIMEIVSKESILSNYQYNHLKIVYKEIEPFSSCTPEIVDVIYRVHNKKKKLYALYSLKEGFLFGPYNYKEIEMHNCGVILDNKYAVENYGYSMDLTEYDCDENDLYISKDKKRFFLFLDQDEEMFHILKKDDYDDNIMITETEHEIFKYDLSTKSCRCELKRMDYEIDLSKFNDIAYEGYSRLELGLED